MTVPAERFVAVLEDVAETCRLTDVDDWSPEQRDLVLNRLREVVREETSLAARIWVVMTGGFECATPPDLGGKCMCCGSRIAPPVTGHKSGCNPFGFLVGAAESATNWTRATVAYLRGVS